MFYKKQGYPEKDELVLCTVKKVLYHSVFVNMDEYEREAVIHISEISPGRIRNIRDYVKEGKRIVCKVLRVDPDKGYIDLSLRRVSLSARKKKNEDYKQEQKAEKILERVALELKTDIGIIYKEIGYKILENFGSLNECFQELAIGNTNILENVGIQKKFIPSIIKIVKEKIKPPEVTINSVISLTSYDWDGINTIKGVLKKAEDMEKNYAGCKFKLLYLGAPRYKLTITAQNYKLAEKVMEESTEFIIDSIKEQGGEAEAQREKKG